jgi:hypothetical protein
LTKRLNASAKLMAPEPREGDEPLALDPAGAATWEVRPVTGTPQDINEERLTEIETERDVRLGELGHDLRMPLSGCERRRIMKRFAPMVVILSLGLAACAHDHVLERREVRAMQNDSPAISPWTGPLPNEAIEQDRLYARGPGDEN